MNFVSICLVFFVECLNLSVDLREDYVCVSVVQLKLLHLAVRDLGPL